MPCVHIPRIEAEYRGISIVGTLTQINRGSYRLTKRSEGHSSAGLLGDHCIDCWDDLIYLKARSARKSGNNMSIEYEEEHMIII